MIVLGIWQSEISSIITANSQIYIIIPWEITVLSLLNSFITLNFDIVHAATKDRLVDGNDISLTNLGAIALFTIYKLIPNSWKHLEDNSHAHIVSSMYKLISSSKHSNDLSIGFCRDRNRRQRELTINKHVKCKCHVRVKLKGVFGLAERREKATNGWGYILTLRGNSDNSVLNKDNAINIGKVKINSIKW